MKALKTYWDHLRERRDDRAWLLLHHDGAYEYRNPDSVYIHPFETFATKEAALDHLERRIAKADQGKWTLYRAEAADSQPGSDA